MGETRRFIYRCRCGHLDVAGTLDEMSYYVGDKPGLGECSECGERPRLVGATDDDVVGDPVVLRRCPAHGLPLRPWHRVGKVECPDSACMYAEPHVCELDGGGGHQSLRCPCGRGRADGDSREIERILAQRPITVHCRRCRRPVTEFRIVAIACSCPSASTVCGDRRIRSGCASCHVVTRDPSNTYQAKMLAEGKIREGDAQCTGRCFDREAWAVWRLAISAKGKEAS